MRYLTRTALIAALAVAATTPAMAQRPQRGPGGGGAGLALWNVMSANMAEMSKELELTGEQQTQIKSLIATVRRDHGETLEHLGQMTAEMRQMRSRGQRPSREEMQALNQKHGNPQAKLQPVMADFQKELRALLTDDQKGKLQSAVQRRMGRRRP